VSRSIERFLDTPVKGPCSVQRAACSGTPSARTPGLGRNGAGNPRNYTRAGSTLLKILSRITEPTSGPVTVLADLATDSV